MKKEYDKKTNTGWIEEQYSLDGNYIEKLEYGGDYGIFLKENNVIVFMSKKQFKILREMIKEFEKECSLE